MKIQCRTTFDCTYTGVTGRFTPDVLPFVDRAGQPVQSQIHWHRSRNQQRNYETLLQLFGLRTQPMNITRPVSNDGVWELTFDCESEGVYAVHGDADELAGLKIDCEGVPMVLGLTESKTETPVMTAAGSEQNIWFQTINTPETNYE